MVKDFIMEESKLASILIVKIAKGEESAFERIYSLYYPKVLFYANQYLTDIEEAREVAQDVFLTVWQKRKELDARFGLQPYILTVTRNRCISILRKRILHRSYREKMLSKEEMANYLALCNHSAETILSVEIENIIDEVIDAFPESTRQVFTMSRTDDMTYNEIAEHLEISVGTVEYRMMKALKSFRLKLKDYLPFILSTILLFILRHIEN